MTKFTKTQRELLTQAASAEAPLLSQEKHNSSVSSLIKRGLLISLPQADGASQLLITEKGRAAVASQSTPTTSGDAGHPPAEATALAPEPRTTKTGALVKLLCRSEGASIAQMMQATGWQAHSVRGALSGAVKKGLGLNVISEKSGPERVYRIDGGISA